MITDEAYARLMNLLRQEIPVNLSAENILTLEPDEIEVVIDALKGSDHRQLVNAMSILEQVGSASAGRVTPLLLALQTYDHTWVRMCSAKTIGILGSTADVAALSNWLQTESDVLVQVWIVSSMGRLGSVEAVDPLIRALQSAESSTLRYTIIRALGELGEMRAAPVIASYLTDEDRHVRSDAQEMLNKLYGLEQTEVNDGR